MAEPIIGAPVIGTATSVSPSITNDVVSPPAKAAPAWKRTRKMEKPLKAHIEFVEGLDPKTAVGYIMAKANDELKLPEICSYDFLKFRNDNVDGYFIEIHQGGSQMSHLKSIIELCQQDDGTRGFFEMAGRRVLLVQMTEGRPDPLILSEGKSAAILKYTAEDFAKDRLVPLEPTRKMKPVVKANNHLVIAGLAGMVIGVLSLLMSGIFYQSQFAAARHARSITPDMMPHLQWYRVARPAPGRYVTKLSFENGQWTQETAPSMMRQSTPGLGGPEEAPR